MSDSTYDERGQLQKPLVWKHGEVRTPPFSRNSRVEAGYLLRLLQKGIKLTLPVSRPMPSVAPNCHELRIKDGVEAWRIIYAIESDAIVILDVFKKKSNKTPKYILRNSARRLAEYRMSLNETYE
jgi:phage-related protein